MTTPSPDPLSGERLTAHAEQGLAHEIRGMATASAMAGNPILADVFARWAARVKTLEQENNGEHLRALLTDVAQLLDGWHQDGTAWTEWDEWVRQRVRLFAQHEHSWARDYASLAAKLDAAEARVKTLEQEKAAKDHTGRAMGLHAQALEAQVTALELTLNGWRAEVTDLRAQVTALEALRTSIVHMVQTRLQPAGSPPPGGLTRLVDWITRHAQQRAEAAEAARDAALQRVGELKDWAIAERASWQDKNADRYWQMNRVVEQIGTCGFLPPAKELKEQEQNKDHAR